MGVSRSLGRGALVCSLVLLAASGLSARTIRRSAPARAPAPKPWPLSDTSSTETVARVALHQRVDSVAKSSRLKTSYSDGELREDVEGVAKAVVADGAYQVEILSREKLRPRSRSRYAAPAQGRSDLAHVFLYVTGPSAAVRRQILHEAEARYGKRPARVDCTVKAAPAGSAPWASCFPAEAAERAAREKESEEVRLMSAALSGGAEAQFVLGEQYADGRGVTRDEAKAARWWRLAAENGMALAQVRLGRLYLKGGGVPEDYAEAKKWFEKAAEQGVAAAQNSLGVIYAKGIGVPAEPGAAAAWYLKAAEQGDAAAQVNLGRALFLGRGVAADRAEAVRWYVKAADAGNGPAQLSVARALRDKDLGMLDSVESHKWLNIAVATSARREAPDGGVDVYEDPGTSAVRSAARGIRETVAQALTVAQLADAQHRARAWMAAHVTADAPGLLRPAAEAGDVDAQYALGMTYVTGNEGLQDFVEALRWINIAVAGGFRREAGSTDAMRRARKALVARMTPEAIAEAQRLAREWADAFEQQADALRLAAEKPAK